MEQVLFVKYEEAGPLTSRKKPRVVAATKDAANWEIISRAKVPIDKEQLQYGKYRNRRIIWRDRQRAAIDIDGVSEQKDREQLIYVHGVSGEQL